MDNKYLSRLKALQSVLLSLRDADGSGDRALCNASSRNQNIADDMHLHKIGGSRNTERHTRRDNGKIAVFQQSRRDSFFYRVMNKVIGIRHHFLRHKRDNAP